MRCVLLLLLPCLACATTPTAPQELSTLSPGVLKAVRCNGVTAQWLGTAPTDAPALYGAEELRFDFADGTSLPFKPRGALNFSDWSSEVFSPGCRWVLLLQDRFGPYHLVRMERLAAYLKGAAPDGLAQSKTKAGEDQVHGDQKWLSPFDFEYFASAGEHVEVFRAGVSAPEFPALVFTAKDAPRGVRRTKDGFEVVP